jgi:hypothetical protein
VYYCDRVIFAFLVKVELVLRADDTALVSALFCVLCVTDCPSFFAVAAVMLLTDEQ